MDVRKLLQFAVENGASDLHLQAGASPMFRISGEPRFAEGRILTAEDTAQFVQELAPEQPRSGLKEALARGLDFSYAIEGLARFRCSAYSHLGTPAMVIRVVKTTVPTIDE